MVCQTQTQCDPRGPKLQAGSAVLPVRTAKLSDHVKDNVLRVQIARGRPVMTWRSRRLEAKPTTIHMSWRTWGKGGTVGWSGGGGEAAGDPRLRQMENCGEDPKLQGIARSLKKVWQVDQNRDREEGSHLLCPLAQLPVIISSVQVRSVP